MARQVYFGNATKQSWIVAPQTAMGASAQGWISETQLLNGQTHVKRSQGSHRVFEMSWLGSMNTPVLADSLHLVKDFADGIYGTGPFFWNDPYAITSNMFAPAWAAPALSVGTDWESICPDNAGVTKEVVTTASISTEVGNNTAGYPPNTAKFTAPGSPTLQSNKFTFYIPTGFTLWLGLHGYHGTTGAAFAKPYLNGTAGTAVNMTPLGVNTQTRFNTSFSSTAASKVEFYLSKIDSGPCTFYISGLMAQLLPTGTAATTGNFVAGRGTTGLEFTSFPTIEYYSANINNGQIGMSVNLTEI